MPNFEKDDQIKQDKAPKQPQSSPYGGSGTGNKGGIFDKTFKKMDYLRQKYPDRTKWTDAPRMTDSPPPWRPSFWKGPDVPKYKFSDYSAYYDHKNELQTPPDIVQEKQLPTGAVGWDAAGRPYYGGSNAIEDWFLGFKSRWFSGDRDPQSGWTASSPVTSWKDINAAGGSWLQRTGDKIANLGGATAAAGEERQPGLITRAGRSFSETLTFLGAFLNTFAEGFEKTAGAAKELQEAGMETSDYEYKGPETTKITPTGKEQPVVNFMGAKTGENLMTMQFEPGQQLNSPLPLPVDPGWRKALALATGGVYYMARYLLSDDTLEEKRRKIDDGWNAGRVLYSTIYDHEVGEEMMRRVRDTGANPYLTAIEVGNPWAEMIGQSALDPLNVFGGVIAKFLKVDVGLDVLYSSRRWMAVSPEIDEAFKVLSKSGDVVQMTSKFPTFLKAVQQTVSDTRNGIAELADERKILSLTSEAKRFVVSRESNDILGYVTRVSKGTPEDILYVVRNMIHMVDDDPNKAESAILALTEIGPSARPFFSKPGVRTAVMLKEALGNFDGSGAKFIKALEKVKKEAPAGAELDAVMGFFDKIIGQESKAMKRMFPTLAEQIARGDKISPALKTLSAFHETMFHKRFSPYPALNTFFSTVYMGMSPGYAMRNMFTNFVHLAVDHGPLILFDNPNKAMEAVSLWSGGVTPKVEGFAKSFAREALAGAGAAAGEETRRVPRAFRLASDWAERIEINAAKRVYGKVYVDTMKKVLGKGLPDVSGMVRAGMPPEVALSFRQLVVKHKGDVRKAADDILEQLKLGRVEVGKTRVILSDEQLKKLDDFPELSRVFDELSDGKLTKEQALRKWYKAVDNLVVRGDDVSYDAMVMDEGAFGYEVIQDLAAQLPEGATTNQEVAIATDYFQAHHQMWKANQEALQQTYIEAAIHLGKEPTINTQAAKVLEDALNVPVLTAGSKQLTGLEVLKGALGDMLHQEALKIQKDLRILNEELTILMRDSKAGREALEDIFRRGNLGEFGAKLPEVVDGYEVKSILWKVYYERNRKLYQAFRESYHTGTISAMKLMEDTVNSLVQLDEPFEAVDRLGQWAVYYTAKSRKYDKFLSDNEVLFEFDRAMKIKDEGRRNAAVARAYAHQMGIPTTLGDEAAQKTGPTLDNSSILKKINKHHGVPDPNSPTGYKVYEKLEDVPPDVAHEGLLYSALDEGRPTYKRLDQAIEEAAATVAKEEDEATQVAKEAAEQSLEQLTAEPVDLHPEVKVYQDALDKLSKSPILDEDTWNVLEKTEGLAGRGPDVRKNFEDALGRFEAIEARMAAGEQGLGNDLENAEAVVGFMQDALYQYYSRELRRYKLHILGEGEKFDELDRLSTKYLDAVEDTLDVDIDRSILDDVEAEFIIREFGAKLTPIEDARMAEAEEKIREAVALRNIDATDWDTVTARLTKGLEPGPFLKTTFDNIKFAYRKALEMTGEDDDVISKGIRDLEMAAAKFGDIAKKQENPLIKIADLKRVQKLVTEGNVKLEVLGDKIEDGVILTAADKKLMNRLLDAGDKLGWSREAKEIRNLVDTYAQALEDGDDVVVRYTQSEISSQLAELAKGLKDSVWHEIRSLEPVELQASGAKYAAALTDAIDNIRFHLGDYVPPDDDVRDLIRTWRTTYQTALERIESEALIPDIGSARAMYRQARMSVEIQAIHEYNLALSEGILGLNQNPVVDVPIYVLDNLGAVIAKSEWFTDAQKKTFEQLLQARKYSNINHAPVTGDWARGIAPFDSYLKYTLRDQLTMTIARALNGEKFVASRVELVNRIGVSEFARKVMAGTEDLNGLDRRTILKVERAITEIEREAMPGQVYRVGISSLLGGLPDKSNMQKYVDFVAADASAVMDMTHLGDGTFRLMTSIGLGANENSWLVADDVAKILSEPGRKFIEDITREFGSRVEFSWGKYYSMEPSLYMTAQVADEDMPKFLGLISKIARDKFGQGGVMLYSDDIIPASDLASISGASLGKAMVDTGGIKYTLEPSLDISFGRTLTDQELREVNEICTRFDIRGFSIKPNKSGIEIVHNTVFSGALDATTGQRELKAYEKIIRVLHRKGLLGGDGQDIRRGVRKVYTAGSPEGWWADGWEAAGYSYDELDSFLLSSHQKAADYARRTLEPVNYEPEAALPIAAAAGAKRLPNTKEAVLKWQHAKDAHEILVKQGVPNDTTGAGILKAMLDDAEALAKEVDDDGNPIYKSVKQLFDEFEDINLRWSQESDPKVYDKYEQQLVAKITELADQVRREYQGVVDGLGGPIARRPVDSERLAFTAVVNEIGLPQDLWHGTTGDFVRFQRPEYEIGIHAGNRQQAEGRVWRGKAPRAGAVEGKFKHVYFDIRNPIEFDVDLGSWGPDIIARWFHESGRPGSVGIADEIMALEDELKDSAGDVDVQAWTKATIEILKNHGYDGYVYPNLAEAGGLSWAVFDPEQIIDYDDVIWDTRPIRPTPDIKAQALEAAPTEARAVYEQRDGLRAFRDEVATAIDQNWYRSEPVNGSPDLVNEINNWANQSESVVNEARLLAQKSAEEARKFSLLNYGERKNFDTALSYLFPYHFWYSRTYANWMNRIVMRPGLLAGYYRYKDAMAKAHADSPEWWKYNVNVGELLGIDSANPLYFNLEASLNPLNGLTGVDFNDPKRRVNWWTDTLDSLGKFGPSVWTPWQLLTATALYMQGEEDAAARWGGRLIPQTSLLRSATAAVGLNQGKGVELDPAVHIFSNGLGPYDRRQVGRALGQMVQERALTQAQANEAAVLMKGPVWDQAVHRAMMGPSIFGLPEGGRFAGQISSFLLGQGFRMRFESDMQIDEMDEYLDRFYSIEETIAPEKVQEFFDWMRSKYPFFDTVTLSRKDADQRDRLYSYSVLGRIPPGQKGALLDAVGSSEALVSKFYDEKGHVWKWPEADRQKWMLGIIEIGALLEMPNDVTKAEWNAASARFKEFEETRKRLFGQDIDTMVDEFFMLRRKNIDQANEYIEANPVLGQYLDFKASAYANDPLLQKYYGSLEDINSYYKGLMYDELEWAFPDIQKTFDEYNRLKLTGENVMVKDKKGKEVSRKAYNQFWKAHPELQRYLDLKDLYNKQLADMLVEIEKDLPEKPYPFMRDDLPETMTVGQQDVMQQIQEPEEAAPEAYRFSYQDWQQIVPKNMKGLMDDYVFGGEPLPSAADYYIERIASNLGISPEEVLSLYSQAAMSQ